MKIPQHVGLSLLLLCGILRADIQIDSFSNAVNDRFTNDSAFLLNNYNLSAVGKSGDRWATLVSPNVILAANHFRPNVNSVVTFYESNDPDSAFETRRVVTGQRLGETDLWLGVLDSELPAQYEPLPFAGASYTNANVFRNSVYGKATYYLLGISPTSPDVALDTAIGRNVLYTFVSSQDVGGLSPATGPAIITSYSANTDTDYVTYETQLALNDSGAPLLAVINNELTVIGINWFIGTSGSVEISGMTYVGNNANQIQAIIDAYAGVELSVAYGVWTQAAFSGVDDITQMLPAEDYDGDGRSNYDEFALVFDPLVYDYAPAGITEVEGDHLLLTLNLQQNTTDLAYQIAVGNDLSGWTRTSLTCLGASWVIGNTAIATVANAVDNGSTWTVTIRDATTITNGAPRFIRVEYE